MEKNLIVLMGLLHDGGIPSGLQIACESLEVWLGDKDRPETVMHSIMISNQNHPEGYEYAIVWLDTIARKHFPDSGYAKTKAIEVTTSSPLFDFPCCDCINIAPSYPMFRSELHHPSCKHRKDGPK